jgi:FMN phosphatase YigB (HAD superfamily)
MTSPLSHPQKRIRHVLCDLDGTLIYSGDARINLEFIGRTLPKLKIHQGWRAAVKVLKDSQSILKIPSSIETNFERLLSVFQKNLKLDRESAIGAMKMSMDDVFPKLQGHFGEMKGAKEFLEWATENYSLVLATNPVWSIELVKLRMRWGGINPDLFQSITTADRMHACKPSVEYYQEILAQEKFDPSECLLIGNDREMDLPATDAGIGVFLIRLNAKNQTCSYPPSKTCPGAWRGNYTHLRSLLEMNTSISI